MKILTQKRSQLKSLVNSSRLPGHLNSTSNTRSGVLNAEVQIDENGSTISPDDSPYIWLGDVCAGQPEIFQPEVATCQHMIADPNKKSTTALPLNPSALYIASSQHLRCTTPTILLLQCSFLEVFCWLYTTRVS